MIKVKNTKSDWCDGWCLTEKVRGPVKNYATETDDRVTKDAGWVMSTK